MKRLLLIAALGLAAGLGARAAVAEEEAAFSTRLLLACNADGTYMCGRSCVTERGYCCDFPWPQL